MPESNGVLESEIIPSPDHPEVQELTEQVGSLRHNIRSDLRKAREYERKAREAEVEATGNGEVAEFEEKAEAARKTAKEKSHKLAEVEERRDALAEEVDEEAKEAFNERHAELLLKAADATEQAIEAHRKLRALELEFKQYIELAPNYPLAKDWLYKQGEAGAGAFVERARETATEKWNET